MRCLGEEPNFTYLESAEISLSEVHRKGKLTFVMPGKIVAGNEMLLITPCSFLT